MGRGREPRDGQQGNSQREEGGWVVEGMSREQELTDRQGDKLAVSKDTDMS